MNDPLRILKMPDLAEVEVGSGKDDSVSLTNQYVT